MRFSPVFFLGGGSLYRYVVPGEVFFIRIGVYLRVSGRPLRYAPIPVSQTDTSKYHQILHNTFGGKHAPFWGEISTKPLKSRKNVGTCQRQRERCACAPTSRQPASLSLWHRAGRGGLGSWGRWSYGWRLGVRQSVTHQRSRGRVCLTSSSFLNPPSRVQTLAPSRYKNKSS